MESLGDQVSTLQKRLEVNGDEIRSLKTALSARDKEIARLGNIVVEGGDFDRKNLDQINKTNSQIVRQLQGQIDFLTEQLAETEIQLNEGSEAKGTL